MRAPASAKSGWTSAEIQRERPSAWIARTSIARCAWPPSAASIAVRRRARSSGTERSTTVANRERSVVLSKPVSSVIAGFA